MKIYSPIDMIIYVLENPLKVIIPLCLFAILAIAVAKSKSKLWLYFINFIRYAGISFLLFFALSMLSYINDIQNKSDTQFSLYFYSHIKLIEICALIACLWGGQSTGRIAKLSTLLEHATLFSGTYMSMNNRPHTNAPSYLFPLIVTYLYSLILIPLSIGIFFLQSAFITVTILFPASLLDFYDSQWNRLFQTAAIGTLFFIAGLTSVSLIRASQMERDSN